MTKRRNVDNILARRACLFVIKHVKIEQLPRRGCLLLLYQQKHRITGMSYGHIFGG